MDKRQGTACWLNQKKFSIIPDFASEPLRASETPRAKMRGQNAGITSPPASPMAKRGSDPGQARHGTGHT